MIAATTTTTLLLDRLRDPAAHEAWQELDGRYRPILFGLARRIGLSDADAADAAQETMTRFARRYREGAYDRGRGRLRSWMMGIARNVMSETRGRRTPEAWRGDSVLALLPDEQGMSRLWDEERRASIVTRALEHVRRSGRITEQTVAAFEAVVFHGRTPRDVADELGLTRHDVYVAKHRVIEKLRETVARLESLYDEED